MGGGYSQIQLCVKYSELRINFMKATMTLTPQALISTMPEYPASSDFVAMGQALVGKQPSLMSLIDRCADSLQAESRAQFEAGFIAEKIRRIGEAGALTEVAIRACHLKRTTHDYDSPEAQMAWWAWQAAGSANIGTGHGHG